MGEINVDTCAKYAIAEFRTVTKELKKDKERTASSNEVISNIIGDINTKKAVVIIPPKS